MPCLILCLCHAYLRCAMPQDALNEATVYNGPSFVVARSCNVLLEGMQGQRPKVAKRPCNISNSAARRDDDSLPGSEMGNDRPERHLFLVQRSILSDGTKFAQRAFDSSHFSTCTNVAAAYHTCLGRSSYPSRSVFTVSFLQLYTRPRFYGLASRMSPLACLGAPSPRPPVDCMVRLAQFHAVNILLGHFRIW